MILGATSPCVPHGQTGFMTTLVKRLLEKKRCDSDNGYVPRSILVFRPNWMAARAE